MGGDDLGSDDEYLNASVQETGGTLESLENLKNGTLEQEQTPRKRKRGVEQEDSQDETESVEEVSLKKSSARVLLDAGRNLENQTTEVQAKFLWTALTHNLQLKGETLDGVPKLRPSHFLASTETTLPSRLRGAVSMKKLKKWKPLRSPMVIIVCVSARRAVAVLKELACLKIRAAKLFAKHMDLRQQEMLLRQHSFGVAVGTPHRLQALFQPSDESNEGALSLQHTQIVLLDSHASAKGYTVCTLPDTAPDCMNFLRDAVLPQLKKRKDIKIAMF